MPLDVAGHEVRQVGVRVRVMRYDRCAPSYLDVLRVPDADDGVTAGRVESVERTVVLERVHTGAMLSLHFVTDHIADLRPQHDPSHHISHYTLT